MMILNCIDNSGFEDQLTNSTEYRAKEVQGGSYLVLNDKGQERWYGECKFAVDGVSL